MKRERRASVLTPVTPGLSTVAALFALPVRQRAAPYVGTGAIQILKSSATELAARIQGTEPYVSAYELRYENLIYGCSCPFFQDRLEPCKHLWALALEASQSPLIRAAEHSNQCRPERAPQ